jgi:cell division topological specificity factor
MGMLSLFRQRPSAPVARERLEILLSYDRAGRAKPDLLMTLRTEILAVIARHVVVDQDHVQVRMDRGAAVSILGVEVEIPNAQRQALPN